MKHLFTHEFLYGLQHCNRYTDCLHKIRIPTHFSLKQLYMEYHSGMPECTLLCRNVHYTETVSLFLLRKMNHVADDAIIIITTANTITCIGSVR